MDEKVRIIDTIEDLKVFNDPYRMKIINMYKKHDVPLTVKQCADYMNEVPANIHYHVKKLLSIGILELDHIEVINGINAKYYYLPKKAFTIQLKDKETKDIYAQEKEGNSLNSNLLSEFLEQYSTSAHNMKESNTKDPFDIGYVSLTNVYLSKEEFEALNDFFGQIGEKYSTVDKNKKEYSILIGFTSIK
jgi:hypothetical protein